MPRHLIPPVFLTITIVVALIVVQAAKAEPLPDPPPGAVSWSWDKSPYTYDTTSIDGLWRYRCVVKWTGPHRCHLIGFTRSGARFLLK